MAEFSLLDQILTKYGNSHYKAWFMLLKFALIPTILTKLQIRTYLKFSLYCKIRTKIVRIVVITLHAGTKGLTSL